MCTHPWLLPLCPEACSGSRDEAGRKLGLAPPSHLACRALARAMSKAVMPSNACHKQLSNVSAKTMSNRVCVICSMPGSCSAR